MLIHCVEMSSKSFIHIQFSIKIGQCKLLDLISEQQRRITYKQNSHRASTLEKYSTYFSEPDIMIFNLFTLMLFGLVNNGSHDVTLPFIQLLYLFSFAWSRKTGNTTCVTCEGGFTITRYVQTDHASILPY